jgi:hypothetical protein
MTAAPWAPPASPIFGIAAPHYLQLGWAAPLYMPVRGKTPPPDGFTGEDGRYPTYQEVMNWVGQYPHNNIALRMPDDILGIDVDAYEGKLGGQTIANLEAQLGPLPTTWISTSRQDGTSSGIRFYRVPAGMQWKSNIQPHVEIVRRGHRYAMVAPSIHPNGGTYRWCAPGWIPSLTAPRPADLASLPMPWVQFLIRTRDIWAAGSDEQVRALTDRLIDPDGQPCAWLERVTQDWVSKIKAAGAHCHDVGRDAAWAVASDGAKFHRGAFTAMARIREAWMQTRVPSVGSADIDWDGRSGAIEPTAWAKAATRIFDQVFDGCRCHSGEMTSAGDTPSVSADDRIVDLTPYLDGTYQPPEPNVGAKREYDGIQLLYPSRWHTVVGLTEAGKSLFAIWQAVHVIREGGLVVYLHFEETDPRGTLDRVQSFGRPFGLDNDTILKQFKWLDCETRWAEGTFAQALQRLPVAPTLVVLDGINAAVSQHGEEIMHPKSVAQYRTLFVKPATAVGASVLSLGHPVKDPTRQGERHSFGSTAWLDETDGVALRLIATARPITKGRKGSSSLSAVKDRYGEVKKHGEPNTKKEPGWVFLGSFIVDDSPTEAQQEQPWLPAAPDHGPTAVLVLPKAKTPGSGPQANGLGGEDAQDGAEGQESGADELDPKDAADDAAVLAQLAKFRDQGQPANKRAVYAYVKIAKSRVENALMRLVYDGKVEETDGPRGSKIYSLTSELPSAPLQAPWDTATVPHDQI